MEKMFLERDRTRRRPGYVEDEKSLAVCGCGVVRSPPRGGELGRRGAQANTSSSMPQVRNELRRVYR